MQFDLNLHLSQFLDVFFQLHGRFVNLHTLLCQGSRYISIRN